MFSSSAPLGIKLLLLWAPAWDCHASFYHSRSNTHGKPCPQSEPWDSLGLFSGEPRPSPASWDGSHIPKIQGGSWVEQRGVPYLLSLVMVSSHTCSVLTGGNYLDRLGKTGATVGRLPICQLLANWSDAFWNLKSPLRDLLISGRVYTWFLRFLELIEFSLEYFLPPLPPLTVYDPKFTAEWRG